MVRQSSLRARSVRVYGISLLHSAQLNSGVENGPRLRQSNENSPLSSSFCNSLSLVFQAVALALREGRCEAVRVC